MKVSQALNLINNGITERPGYTVTAVDNTHRYGNSVKVAIFVDTYDSGTLESPDMWKEGYPVHVAEPGARAEFNITVDDCLTEMDLLRKIIHLHILVDTHETREFLRFKDTGEAPFHPHTRKGMDAWGTPEIDNTYGLA